MRRHILIASVAVLSLVLILCISGCGAESVDGETAASNTETMVTPVITEDEADIENTAEAASTSTLVKLSEANYYENKYIDYLRGQLSGAVSDSLKFGEDLPDCYSSTPTSKGSEKFPEKYDLRDYDIITPVKDQSPWGTCWAFGTVAAAESSILTAMDLTQTEYQEKYGEPLDLSEKHLAWFTATALPEESDYPEGEYPHDVTQAGEGSHAVNDENSIYNFGGNYFLSTSVMASGTGPIGEIIVPYADSEGGMDTNGDWSVDEELRFCSSFTLSNANVLPAPAKIDKDGNYTYNEAGTNAIKSELLSGHAVGISFRSESSMPKEMLCEIYMKGAMSEESVTEEEATEYARIRSGLRDATKEELRKYIAFRFRINKSDEKIYDLSGLNKDQLYKVLNSPIFLEPLEDVLAYEQKTYMSFPKDENGNTIWAQYVNEPLESSHAVCAVGWDDTFPASYFPEDCRPPADGAWIVKNSWGTDWGMDGYFYLSYYDQTLNGCESFEFVPMSTDTIEVLEKDFMPAECINSTLMDTPVFTSSIFTTEFDGVPQYLSVLTGDIDTEYAVSLYLLEDDAITPTDGKLLDTVTGSAHLAGYHRVKLANNVYVPKGSKLGVTVIERVETDAGNKFALVNTSSLGEKFVEYKNKREPDSQHRYCKGVINSGESFVSFGDDRWIDWKEITDSYYAGGNNFDYIQYDNIPLKVFSYKIDDVRGMHDFSLHGDVPGGSAEICADCGYALSTLDK